MGSCNKKSSEMFLSFFVLKKYKKLVYKLIYSIVLFNRLLKLSAVRKVPETITFQALGSFETLGSKLSHGTSSKFADVRSHLRKVSKRTLSTF